MIGTVEALLTVADALPPQFQNMFRPRDRSRLVRISVPAEHGLAILQKVIVRSQDSGAPHDASGAGSPKGPAALTG